MIIDSPIVSGSFLSTGSLSQIGNAQITGSLTVSGSSISLVNGSFSGSGANLFGIPATGITGLNLSQISSGSVSASISPNLGLLINTSVSASNFTGSFTGSLTGIATSASYAAFALTSSYSLGGSGFPFSGSAVITGSLIISGSGLTITGSVAISTLTTGSGVRYVIADANGLISAQTASAVIFTTQQTIATSGQTVFPITNGYSTGYVTVFVNGTKLNSSEYTDTSGTNIVLATGSMVNDVVEFQKYLPAAGVSNNTLRTVNYFTASLGQTLFNVNYTPGLLDVFYNGSKLDNTEYTAANGTSITLATGSNAGDTLEVDVYSYQVGAFSGIGGTGVANQLAYYNTSNSITGSRNFSVSGSAIIITGSLIVSGSGTLINIGPAIFSGSVSSTGGFSGSFSGNADSASLAANSLLLGGTGSLAFATTSSFATASGSISSRVTQIEQVYATTGSNSFRATQSITGSLTVTGQIIAQTINVQQVTSSIIYSSGSNVFGCDINSRQTFTGSVFITGSNLNVTVGNVCFSGNVCAPSAAFSTSVVVGATSLKSYSSLTAAGQIISLSNIGVDAGQSIRLNNYYNSGTVTDRTISNGYAAAIGLDNSVGAMTFATSTVCAAADNNVTVSERMRITNCGNIGINFPTPSFPLTRNGMTMKAATNDGAEFVMLSCADTGFIGGALVRNGCDFGVINRTNGNLIFATNAQERLYITGAGIACFSCTICSGGSIVRKGFDSHTGGQWYKIPFYIDKNTGAGIATTKCLIVIDNNDSFQELHFTIEYGSRLQGFSDQYTQTSLRSYGVNRFNSSTITLNDAYLLTGGSGCAINTHAPVTVAVVGNCMTVVKVDFSSTLGNSSFVWGEVRIWSIESLTNKITISNNSY